MPDEQSARLRLRDGAVWRIDGDDDESRILVARLKDIMCLEPASDASHELRVHAGRPPGGRSGDYLSASVCTSRPPFRTTLSAQGARIDCHIDSFQGAGATPMGLMALSFIPARTVEQTGGLLLHGALAEYRGVGLLITGGSGAGKSTLSRGLAPPWISRCDDTTLVARDSGGRYWAHAWPTWSQLFGGGNGRWRVEEPVPLVAILGLQQSDTTRTERLSRSRTVGLLVRAAEESSWLLLRDKPPDAVRQVRLQRFGSVCRLADELPSYRLFAAPPGNDASSLDAVLRGCLPP